MLLTGVVRATGGGVYTIALDDGRMVDASLRGRLKLEERTGDKVVIGDRVRVNESADVFTIETVEPRSSAVVRRGRGGRRAKVVAANVDRMMAVFAAVDPAPSFEAIDRLLVIAEANDLPAELVMNKLDLESAREVAEAIAEPYRRIGYAVHLVSAVTKEGVEDVGRVLRAGTSALVGPSGAGKSTLLNVLEPGLGLRTGALSKRARRGRHTTVSARMIPLSGGGLVVDTPGFGDVGVWGIAAEEVAGCFPELREREASCRFRGCCHQTEPDCAVRAAVETGEIPQSRYVSYLALLQEARQDLRD